jgi:hypothetical protein
MRGWFSRYIGPWQERAYKSLKGPIALAIDVLFRFLGSFQLFLVYSENNFEKFT